MIIGIDARQLTNGGSGVETYIFNLIKSLSKIDNQNKYIIYVNEQYHYSDIVQSSNFSFKFVEKSILNTQIKLAKQVFFDKLDVLFCPAHTIPVIAKPFFPIVSFIHGLEYQQDLKSKFKIGVYDLEIKAVLSISNKIIVPSVHTKEKLLGLSKRSGNKISVIPEGVSEDFYKRGLSEILRVKEKYGIDKDYFLFISTIRPRKNIERLINAFSKLVEEEDIENLLLIISGKVEDMEVFNKFRGQNLVRFIGRSQNNDLPALISGAKAYINPSIEEGFGLPILEAFASETLCLASNIDTFKVLGEENIIYFDPKDIEDIKNSMQAAITNRSRFDGIVKNAKEASKEFTWENTAFKTLKLLRDSVKNI